MSHRLHPGPDGSREALLLTRRQTLRGAMAVGGLLFLPMAGCEPSPPPAPKKGPAGPAPSSSAIDEVPMPTDYTLPKLPYAYDALEPHMDAATLKLHHDLHHAGYVKGANKAGKALEEARKSGDFGLVDHWTQKLAFHASGHLLHSLFWLNLAPAGKGGEPSRELAQAIDAAFTDRDKMMAQLSAAAKSVEGSGWGILGWHPFDQSLTILQCQNHEKLTVWSVIPLLVVDVWEHAYYLKYQNKRGDYLKAWSQIVNWKDVSKRFAKARKLEALG